MLRTVFIFLVAVPLITSFCYGDTLTVDDDGPADYTKIQDAINDASDGDTVEVAEGHYYENIDFRGKAITVTGTDPCDPCTVADTIIDAGGDGIVVSFHSEEEPNSIITGFTTTGGNAQYGAGICCWTNCHPTINNCMISGNSSTESGSGIYCYSASPSINNCTIENNLGASSGGGISCQSNSSPTISNCIILGNVGSGIYCHTNGRARINNCIISGNGYAGIYCFKSSSAISYCTISGNDFGIICSSNGTITISYCTVRNNSAYGIGSSSVDIEISNCIISGNSWPSGGGVNCTEGNATITNCTVSDNSGKWGGGIYFKRCNPTIIQCTITGNSSDDNGGGIYCERCDATITYCTISGNSTDNGGGGIYSNYDSNPIISNCNISGNSASLDGGGLHTTGGPMICNSNINGNLAIGNGGGIFSESGNPSISNCSIISNLVYTGDGGGIYCYNNSSSPVITHNIICSSPSGSGIYTMYSQPIFSYNNIWGNTDGDYGGWAWPGEGDISVDPYFVDPGRWEDPCNTPGDLTDDVWVDGDYHLTYDSLCINAGDPCFAADPCEVDMDGESRVRLGRIDIGADEAGSNPADFDESGLVDLSDFDALSAAWLTVPEETGWNRACDISEPADDVIDLLDFSVYSEQWLWEAQWYIP